MEQKFFRCRHCGKIIGMLLNSDTPTICCGEEMEQLVANTSDGAIEKHVPIVTITGDSVDIIVGSVLHPMLPEHFIQWIYLATENGGQFKKLIPGVEPKASFIVKNDKPIAVYEYCNLHGLWKSQL